jgi:hypothetical protein
LAKLGYCGKAVPPLSEPAIEPRKLEKQLVEWNDKLCAVPQRADSDPGEAVSLVGVGEGISHELEDVTSFDGLRIGRRFEIEQRRSPLARHPSD